ncbi:MAG TPA: methylmalonyl Co-A mutase-associated GTPase MeaB, partial [Dehalococcoidia bacterium]
AVVAARDEGVEALLDAVEGHRAYLAASGRLGAQAQARAERQVLGLARERLLGAARAALGEAALAGLVAAVAAHELDPHTAADRLVAALLQDRE